MLDANVCSSDNNNNKKKKSSALFDAKCQFGSRSWLSPHPSIVTPVKSGKIKIPVSCEVQAPLLSGWGGRGAVSVETLESSETVENTWTYWVRSVV